MEISQIIYSTLLSIYVLAFIYLYYYVNSFNRSTKRIKAIGSVVGILFAIITGAYIFGINKDDMFKQWEFYMFGVSIVIILYSMYIVYTNTQWETDGFVVFVNTD